MLCFTRRCFIPIQSSSRIATWHVRSYTAKVTEKGNHEAGTPPPPSQASADASKPSVDEGKKQTDALEKQVAELKDMYLRSLADMENLRERTRREVAAAKDFSLQKFAKDLLDTVDILDLAIRSVPKDVIETSSTENPHLHALHTGVSMTERELLRTLGRHGVERMTVEEGGKFDPNLHQALFQVPMQDKEPGSVLRVEKQGYTIKGRVLRPAQVGVVKDPEA